MRTATGTALPEQVLERIIDTIRDVPYGASRRSCVGLLTRGLLAPADEADPWRFWMRSEHVKRFASIVLVAGITLMTVASAADAKPWRKWAPAPLASDSSYAALVTRPAAELSPAEASWLALQRDWRAQRDAEDRGSYGISEPWRPRHERPTDKRFASLAARHYAALADSERAWLVAENAAQQADRAAAEKGSASTGSKTVTYVLIALAAGALAAYFTTYAIIRGLGS